MTRYLQNLHTHTTYCDGKDSPEEMILAACRKGFRSIGFSGHSYMYYAPEHSMSVERTEAYRKEIASLAEKYAGEIDVFCGLEFDLFSKVDLSGYDYLIGSVHYLPIGEGLVGFDRSAEVVRSVIRRYFDGDGMAYAKAYYEQLARLPEYGDFDIVGHFDLITKHSENEPFFDVNSREYQQAALEAAESLAGKIPFFEVNTGAIARGYRTTPYPAPFLLKELRRMGFGAVISSDCHDSSLLDCGFPVFAFVWDVLRIDPSIIPAMFFANDMGGAQLAVEVAESEAVGRFNALIVSSMMGATVSFSIPYALGVVEARQHKWLLLGLLCGIVMIPFGCLVSGLMLGLSIGALIFNLLPLQLFSVVIAIGLVKFPDVCVKIFGVFAVFIRIVITIGLAIGIVEFMTGRKILQNTATLDEGVAICLNASVVMSGAFPLIHVVSKVLAKQLRRVGEKVGVNESSAVGFLSTLATNVTTFGIMGKMDEKGVMLNSAFAVSAAFVFAGHLAFTVAFDAAYLPAMMAGKLIAGLLALLLANIIYKRVDKARQTGDEVLAW